MLTDERLSEIEKIKWCGEHGFIPIELIDEIKRLRAELARYKTPNVDSIEVIP